MSSSMPCLPGWGYQHPEFIFGAPSDYQVDLITKEFVPAGSPNGTKGSSGLYQNGVVYLSLYVFGTDLALTVASIGHDLAHDWRQRMTRQTQPMTIGMKPMLTTIIFDKYESYLIIYRDPVYSCLL